MKTADNYTYFKDNLPRFIKSNPGKFVIIANCKEQGFFDTFDLAYCDAIKKYKLGSFVVQECVKQPSSIATFYSRING